MKDGSSVLQVLTKYILEQLYSGKGAGAAAAHLHLKKQARISRVLLLPLKIDIF